MRAQQPERVRQIGMLNALGSDDPEAQARIAVFKQSLQQLGWVVGQNLKIEIRQIGADVDRLRSNLRLRCPDGQLVSSIFVRFSRNSNPMAKARCSVLT